MSIHTCKIDENVHAAFCAFIDTHKVSQAQVARWLGISPVAVSAYRSKTYQANSAAMEVKIRALLLRKDTLMDAPPTPRVELRSFVEVHRALSFAQVMSEMAVIVGGAGTGKSTALREYVVRKEGALLLEVDSGTTVQSLMRSIARALRVRPLGSLSGFNESFVSCLKEKPMLLIFDEADYLSEACLQWMRRVVYDKGGCAVALCGSEKLEGVLRAARGECDQLLNRVGVFVRIGRVSVADTCKLAAALWGNASAAVINTVHAEGRGSVGRIVKLMRLASRIAHNNHEGTPSVQSVREASSYLMTEVSSCDLDLKAQGVLADVNSEAQMVREAL